MTRPKDRSASQTEGKLQDTLDAIAARTRQLVPADRLAISECAIGDLFSTGIEDRALSVGAPMPAFALPDAVTGVMVRSADLLALAPLIVIFFRGRWCPYCTTQLEAWRDRMPQVRRHGGLLVAISPQTPRQNAFLADQLFREAAHGSSFPILSDPGSQLAASFGLAYTIPQRDRSYFRSILANIPFANSGLSYDTAPDSAWLLPMAATFVVGQAGEVLFAEAHADFRVRAEPAEVLDHLTGPAR